MLMIIIKNILFILWAVLRLLSLAVVFVISGLHGILFNRNEIVGVTMHSIPISPDRDKMAYLDDLERRNIDTTFGQPLDYNSPAFRGDGDYDDYYNQDNGYYGKQMGEGDDDSEDDGENPGK